MTTDNTNPTIGKTEWIDRFTHRLMMLGLVEGWAKFLAAQRWAQTSRPDGLTPEAEADAFFWVDHVSAE